jgi:hypothetical protein
MEQITFKVQGSASGMARPLNRSYARRRLVLCGLLQMPSAFCANPSEHQVPVIAGAIIHGCLCRVIGQNQSDQGVGVVDDYLIGFACKRLNRRGGKKSSFNWESFKAALTQLGVAQPRIVERERRHVVFA